MVNSTRVWLEFDSVDDDSYTMWQKFRAACNGHENLGICIRNAGAYKPAFNGNSSNQNCDYLARHGGFVGKSCTYDMKPREDWDWDYSKWLAER